VFFVSRFIVITPSLFIYKAYKYYLSIWIFCINPALFTIVPDGCIAPLTLAALEQGIPVIAVRENGNIMKNDLSELTWQSGQLHIVENYWEAVGVMSALKAGVLPASVRRPLSDTTLL